MIEVTGNKRRIISLDEGQTVTIRNTADADKHDKRESNSKLHLDDNLTDFIKGTPLHTPRRHHNASEMSSLTFSYIPALAFRLTEFTNYVETKY